MSTNKQADQNGPAGNSQDNDYVSRTGQSEIPVQKDEAQIEDPIDAATADSDEQLGMFLCLLDCVHANFDLARDEQEAIDEDNVISSRTRGATKKAGTYTEPGDEEGLPGPEDGTSTVRWLNIVYTYWISLSRLYIRL